MDKCNLDLFKQALSEGISNKFDILANTCDEEIAYSEKHELAMRAIVYGKADTRRVLSPKMKRIIAILVAAALLLTGCCAIFHNEIREIINEIFVELRYSQGVETGQFIDEVYELSYLPTGYTLQESVFLPNLTKYIFSHSDGHTIRFEQSLINGFSFVIDNESGYSELIKLNDYTVYYKCTSNRHYYVWTDEIYVMQLKSSTQLTDYEIQQIINGIVIKS